MKHLPKINVSVIPHSKQRYDTCGDYYKKSGTEHITVSKSTADYEFLVLLHELIEWYLTEKRGISEQAITRFDLAAIKRTSNPGALKSAPYHREHMFSERIEKLVAKELKVNWADYGKEIDKLKWRKSK